MNRCKDCVAEGVTTTRVLAKKRDGTLQPGPRCVTHHRARRKVQSRVRWSDHLMKTYRLTEIEYSEILRIQDGYCAICRRANGFRKRLSVDHDHATGKIRGLLCSPCNTKVLGHSRDEVEFFERGADYLRHPPAERALGERVVSELTLKRDKQPRKRRY